MPRKAFIHDLHEASKPGRFLALTNVKSGEDDGTLSCSLILSEDPRQSVDLEFMVTGKAFCMYACTSRAH